MPISYLEALDVIHQLATLQRQSRQNVPPTEMTTLESSLGRECAMDIYSARDTPPHPTSAMDGYVVDATVVCNASSTNSVRLRVVGTLVAGQKPFYVSQKHSYDMLKDEVHDGICWEIMTGAIMPDVEGGHYNAVIKVEDVSEGGFGQEVIVVSQSVPPYAHHRLAGHDFQHKSKVLSTNTMIRPQHISALASVGISKVMVKRRIRIGVASIGDELKDHTFSCPQDKHLIYDANGPYIMSKVALGPNIEVSFIGIIPDKEQNLLDLLKNTANFDIIITSGAVSAGKFDLLCPTLDSLPDYNIAIHHVAIRPGHPVLVATRGTKTTLFGLPGNPVATAACMDAFVLPFLRTLNGCTTDQKPLWTYKIDDSAYPSHLTNFLLAKLESGVWTPLPKERQRSSLVSALSEAEGWVVVSEGNKVIEVIPFS